MATISQTKTKKVFFSIRWKILIAFLLILGVSYYFVATSLINLVGKYLFDTKVNQESATVEALAVEMGSLYARGDTDALYEAALRQGQNLEGRILIIDMDGKVQIDTSSQYNGWRFGHPEVISVLNGAAADHGFHLLSYPEAKDTGIYAPFDFLRSREASEQWVGYFSAAMVSGFSRNGVVLYSVSVQSVVDNLRAMQDRMLLYFFAAALAVLLVSLVFSRIITKPVAALTEGIKRMGRGDLSGRVKVTSLDEMGRLAATFNQMSEKLEHLDQSRNEFVTNASHELKTPLATMKIMLESMMYQEDMDPALRAEFMGDINRELDRLSGIVTDLLTLVQTDSNSYRIARSNIRFKELVADTLRRLEPMAKEKGQTIELRAQADCPLFADPIKLQQVVYNLVDNAIKYSPKVGKIRVTVKQEGKTAVLEVMDNGPGIPQKDQAHIFDRFYRVDRARSRDTGGNGLGLSIVHQAVLMHGGSVSVKSEEGKGSTFRVELPME